MLLDSSSPALAQTQPGPVSTISTPRHARTTRSSTSALAAVSRGRRCALAPDRSGGSEQIHQDRAVAVGATNGKIIDTEHRDSGGGRIRQRAHQPQQTVPAHHHPQHPGRPRPGPPGQRQPDRLQQPPQQPRAPSVLAGQPGNLLGKCAPSTGGVLAEEPPNPQADHYRPRADRRIGQLRRYLLCTRSEPCSQPGSLFITQELDSAVVGMRTPWM